MQHRKFNYNSVQDVLAEAERLGVHLPMAAGTDALLKPLQVAPGPRAGALTFANRMGIAPMEASDSLPDGSPSEYTFRRYTELAESGVGLIWFEAVCVVPEGRSGSHQLMITRKNVDAYKRLVAQVREAGQKACGRSPYLIMQASHNGRYSNPNNSPAPLIMYRNPLCEKTRPASDSCVLSDDALKRVEEQFGEGALLAKEAGFDAVDVKACHGYLLSESFSAYERPGVYGGSFENRTRLFRNSISASQVHESAGFSVTARVNLYDGFPYPYGFGVEPGGGIAFSKREPVQLVQQLYDQGIRFANLTMGNAYVTSHVMKAYDAGGPEPPEHAFESLATTIGAIGEVKRAVPQLVVWGSKPSYMRQFADLYAAGAVEEGLCDGMLFGRLAFANPSFAKDVAETGRIDQQRTCRGCGLCSGLIRVHKPTGCTVHNSDYRSLYKQYVKQES